MHGLAHVLGLDSQTSYWYCYWSGIGTQVNLGLLGGGAAWWAKHNCRARRCWRMTHHEHGLCGRHRA